MKLRGDLARENVPDKCRIPKPQPTPFQTRERNSKGLAQSTFLIGNIIRETMEPLGGVEVPAGECAVERGRGEENDVRAGIVPPDPAVLARGLGAGDAGFDGDAVAHFPLGDAFPDFDYFSS